MDKPIVQILVIVAYKYFVLNTAEEEKVFVVKLIFYK